jgi:hypothetical protein
MKILDYFKREKEQQEQTEEEQIKDCLYKFWEHCQTNGYRLQGYKDGVLLPDVLTFEIIRR